MERIELMFAQFDFDYDKDYKTLVKILSKPAAKRVASAYLIELCKVIRAFAPSVVLNTSETKPVRGTDKAFRISSNYEGKIYISDFAFAYEVVPDAKSDKHLNANLLSNHPICHDDASSLDVDHRCLIFFRQKPSSMKN